jgi:uncharacterized protein with GYD domain
MLTYVTLSNFTDQGIRNIKDSPKRVEAFRALAKKNGCTLKEVLWTHGQYDMVAIMEAPDEATANHMALSVAKLGNVRSQTLRAFTAAEMTKFLEKLD